MTEIEGRLIAQALVGTSVTFGGWLTVNIETPAIEVKEGVTLDAATRRFLNACADQLGAKRPCEGPGLEIDPLTAANRRQAERLAALEVALRQAKYAVDELSSILAAAT